MGVAKKGSPFDRTTFKIDPAKALERMKLRDLEEEEEREARKKPKLIVEGILRGIPKVKREIATIWDGFIGSGGQSHAAGDRYTTVLEIEDTKDHPPHAHTYEFEGIVFPDSIGNIVELYEHNDSRFLKDTKLNRVYK